MCPQPKTRVSDSSSGEDMERFTDLKEKQEVLEIFFGQRGRCDTVGKGVFTKTKNGGQLWERLVLSSLRCLLAVI